MDTIQFPARNIQVTIVFGTAGQYHGIKLVDQILRRCGGANMCLGVEGYALGLHLRHAAVDDVHFHLEVGYAVAHQPADAITLFIQCHFVPGACQLLRTGHACGTGPDDGNPFAGLVDRYLWCDPALFPALVDNRTSPLRARF